ncbi:unnamed protein product [Soboliphyme baturini]|uniref:Alpha-galactosidase n=1 Tax=Soboliphyme baturini TaxID=241478 RepID=A0A183I9V2_9BILA|nr:unnamed protein product [Soboliphyme baturini]
MNLIALLVLFVVHTSRTLDNGLVRTPPMGWLSWMTFMCETDCQRHPLRCISERLYMQMADLLKSEGYAEVGYEFVNIDDCWSERKRNEDGTLEPDHDRFPSGNF